MSSDALSLEQGQQQQQQQQDDDDDGILLRRYQPEDHPMVCEIFRQGMESNSAAAWRSVCTSRNVVAIMLSLGSLVGSGVWYTTTGGKTTRVTTTGRTQQQHQALGVALGSSVLTVLGFMAMTYVKISGAFTSYVEQSLKDGDLQSPAEFLKVFGGKGAIVVAEDKLTNKIVGVVAGQEIIRNEMEEESGVVFELRRMSVDTRIQRRGIGKRLIRQLEKELPVDKPKKIILFCSSIQYAAHSLYEKSGFTLRQTTTFDGLSWLFRQGVGVIRYEKDYT